MNPYYAAPPPPSQQQQQRPKVDLDDLFGGPSSPAPLANANNGSVGYDAAPAPPPPSYDTLGGNGYGAQPGYYGGPSPPPVQGYAAGMAPAPQPSQLSHGVPQAAHVAATPQQEPYYGVTAAAAPQGLPSPQVYAPQPRPGAPHPSGPGGPIASSAATPAGAVEDERAQLERIIRLRQELEQEQEREQRKKEELQTWGCAVCTYRNKLDVVKCEVCESVRPGYAAPATPSPSTTVATVPAAPASASAAARSNRAGVTAWQCGMCLAPNDAAAERCKVCYAYRSSGTPVPTTSAVGGGGTGVVSNTPFTTRWKCSVCGEVNVPSSAHCKICNGFQRNGTAVVEDGPSSSSNNNNKNSGSDPPLPTTWSCSVCTFENPTSASVCTACDSGQRPRHLAPKQDKKAHKNSKAPGEEKTKREDTKGATQWPCPTCTFLNPLGRKKCDMCGAKRPDKYASAADTVEARADARHEAQDDEEEVAWQDDSSVTECNNCHTTFTFLTRRHHCRLCGYVFCAHCSSYVLNLTEGAFPQRVCVNCYKARQEKEKKMTKTRKWLTN